MVNSNTQACYTANYEVLEVRMYVCAFVYLFAALFKDNESISDYTV